jgi:excisionase family DNA binding protein
MYVKSATGWKKIRSGRGVCHHSANDWDSLFFRPAVSWAMQSVQRSKMNPSSRTPEGERNSCPVCGHEVHLEPSHPPGDAPCPHCGQLLWFDDRQCAVAKVFTIGQAARICKVSNQTLTRCFDAGQLQGWRAGLTGRRLIPRFALHKFMCANGIATTELDRSSSD